MLPRGQESPADGARGKRLRRMESAEFGTPALLRDGCVGHQPESLTCLTGR